MFTRHIETVTPQGQRARGIAQALHVEAGDLFFEPANAQQHLAGRDAAVFKIQLAPLLATHEVGRLANGEPRRAALHQHRANAVHPGAKAHINQKQRRMRAVGGKHLAAVDDHRIALQRGAGDQLGHRRAGFGLAHAQADHLLAFEQARQVTRFLGRAGVFHKGANGAKVAGLHDVSAFWASQGHLLDGQHRVHQATALATVALVKGNAEQALAGQGFGHIGGVSR